ncbi:hypothetical protein AB6A40_004236 [Gnathostoma spinigerum]|uniref:PRELI/MSF1 domain-containing protein n=1 Tax=Gnathostoma spinigerum TaxID=75299 RepID=A0ABD6ELT5_9BILA
MKIWTSEHVFDHPWSVVVNAAWQKYPNPMNGAVTGMDVVKQNLTGDGVLHSERIIQSRFPIPSWVSSLTGFSGTQYSHEVTEIDPSKQVMNLTTRNVNGSSFLRVDEKLIYSPDPNNPERTVLRQEAAVTVILPAFTDYCEKTFLSVYQSNADKGRKGIEWVIDQFKRYSVSDLSSKMSSGVCDVSGNVLAFNSNNR